MCSRLCIMAEGRVLRTGPTGEVFADPGSPAAARLTGCKNIAPARKVGEHRVEVPGWGIHLTVPGPVPDDLAAVGIRAHSFRPGGEENGCRVMWTRTLEEPFEWSALFRFSGQSRESPDLWWRMAKEDLPSPMPEQLGVAGKDVLLLRSVE